MLKQKQRPTSKILFMILISIIVIGLSGCNEHTQTLNQKGVVVHVVDGDTFDVELENGETERVRLILINAPEICHESSPSDCKAEPYGNQAAAFTTELLDGQTVYLEQDVSERDPYGRLLAYAYLENGQMVQEIILAEGLAEVAVYEPDVKYQAQFEKIEQEAKDQHVNLWSN